MKKISYLLVAMLFLAGCANMTMEVGQHDLPETGFSEDVSVLAEPPFQLSFDGYDSLRELESMLEKDEEHIEAYLYKHNFLMNGLQTRDDIKTLFTALRGTYLPVIRSANPPSITIFPQRDELAAMYELENDVVYLFWVSLIPDSAKENIQHFISSDEGRLSEEMSKSEKDITIHFFEDDKDKNNAIQTYVMDVRGVYVLARVSGETNRTSIVDKLQAVEFTSIDVAMKTKMTLD